MVVGEDPGVDLRAPVKEQGGDDQEDHAQDQPGGLRVRAEEAGGPAAALRGVPHPDHGERDDRGQHGHREQVLDEPDERPVPDARDGERPGEQGAVGLDDRQQQHDEAPERQRMRYPGNRPLQQLALPDHLGRLGLHIPAGMLPHGRDALGSGLPAHRQQPQPPQPPTGERERDRGQDQADDHPHNHREPPSQAEEFNGVLPQDAWAATA